MSHKLPKPSLSGQRIKTRKRDEKEKYEPNLFRDNIVFFLNQCDDLEKAYKYLDGAGSKLDYHRYGETLFDILITGAILAPGGSLVIDPELGICKISVFEYPNNDEQYKALAQLFNKIIRRYKYLEKSLEDDLKKVLVFIKGFDEEQKNKLSKFIGVLLANNFVSAKVLETLFQDHLVKDGLAIEFAKSVFKSWINKKESITNVSNALKRNNLDDKLLNLLPPNKRSAAYLEEHLKAAGLESLVTLHRAQVCDETKKTFRVHLKKMLGDTDLSFDEMVGKLKSLQQSGNFEESDVIVLIWNTLMNMVEWNKKEDLIAEQTLKHLKVHAQLLKAFVTSPKTEATLLARIQEYCYDNMNFMKVFQKIVITLYKSDVISEETIIDWYTKNHSSKGKTTFLEQMRSFVHWLQNAEEESESESDDEIINALADDENKILDGIREITIENGAV
ncbi:unnamed protein product [Gordionus sp. m RMFG-2023]|uniref:eIF5-mimic protein 2-like n=1 Tax=Gordionus sp. m RMFG-2023 TaxID=3053472 RepID=UPI0030E51A28